MSQMKGRDVKKIREARGETQLQFAQALGVTESTVWRWENEQVAISRPMSMLIRASHPASEGLPALSAATV